MAGDQTVRDYVTLVRGTTYKGNLVGKPGPALLGLGSIHPGGGFRESDYKTYGGDCPPKLMLVPGDLFVSLKGATKDGKMIGSIARVPASVASGRLTQDTVKLEFRNTDKKKESSYLYWLLRTPQYRDYCEGRAMGSAVVALSRDDFLDFPVPNLCFIRKRIVDVLECIEAKIECNRRMNATLESMARALFQSWFVDFDPVRAKLDGRAPTGIDPATAALFPDSFQDSELGPIPKGWECRRLRDVADILSGGTPRRTNPIFWDGTLPWISPKSMAQIHVHDSDEHVSVSAIGNGTRRVPEGTVLVMVRGMGLHHGVRISQAKREVTFNQDVKAIVGKSVPSTLLFFHLLHVAPFLLSKVHASGHGTGVLSTEFIDGLHLVLPPNGILERLTHPLDVLNSRIAANDKQSRTLAAIRDALLPKLLSGELRVAG